MINLVILGLCTWIVMGMIGVIMIYGVGLTQAYGRNFSINNVIGLNGGFFSMLRGILVHQSPEFVAKVNKEFEKGQSKTFSRALMLIPILFLMHAVALFLGMEM